MIDRLQPSPFISPEAVTVWDTWFRWREDGRLRDVSIEATWQRVARTLSAVEAKDGPRWKARFFDAQSRWQLIFDERILARAGTREAELPCDPVAVLNAATFVGAALTAAAHFDFDAFRNTAALAVRGLDNILLPRIERDTVAPDLRVGLIGVADALALLGKRYDGAAGRVMAGEIARVLAEGCLCGSVRLARERGAFGDAGAFRSLPSRSRGLGDDLLAELARCGIRHGRLTEISSQPRLARLANNVADALDPVDAALASEKVRDGRSPGYSLARARTAAPADAASALCAPLPKIALPAQIALRGAVQPWIDTLIDYPFHVDAAPGASGIAFWLKFAAAHSLGAFSLIQGF